MMNLTANRQILRHGMPSVDLEHRDSLQRDMKKQNYSTSSKLE